MAMDEVLFWRGNRAFTQRDVDLVFQVAREFPGLSRDELASTLCEVLPWKAPNGRLRRMACLALLAELADKQGLAVPTKEARRPLAKVADWGEPPPLPKVEGSLTSVQPVTVGPVDPSERLAWNAMIDAYHPLGFRRAFGAHIRYWVHGEVGGRRQVLGGLLFAAAAKALWTRDAYIGWDPLIRQRYRHHIVANSRFLILPTVRVPHLASFVLAQAMRRLGDDYRQRYGYRPALVETFVEPPWRGTCYLACGFVSLGTTQGRGRQDRYKRRAESVKQVLVRPLSRHWRRDLLRDDAPPPEEEEEDKDA